MRRHALDGRRRARHASDVEPRGASGGLDARLIAAALAISGAVSMVYEVAWTRALALVIGSSTYAFSAMLVAFLVGIAGGAAVYAYFWGARRAGAASFAAIQAGIGLSVALVVLVFERLPEFFLSALLRSQSPSFVQVIQVVASGLVLLGPALLIGATFPCAVAACASTAARAGADTGSSMPQHARSDRRPVLTGSCSSRRSASTRRSRQHRHEPRAGGAPLRGSVGQCPSPVGRLRRCARGRGRRLPFLAAVESQVMSSGVAIYALDTFPTPWAAGSRRARPAPILYYRDGPVRPSPCREWRPRESQGQR